MNGISSISQVFLTAQGMRLALNAVLSLLYTTPILG